MVTHTQESGSKIENMAKENTYMQMVSNTQVNGSTVKKQELVVMSGQMVPGMKVSTPRAINMAKVS